jgi:hypothetical protein
MSLYVYIDIDLVHGLIIDKFTNENMSSINV